MTHILSIGIKCERGGGAGGATAESRDTSRSHVTGLSVKKRHTPPAVRGESRGTGECDSDWTTQSLFRSTVIIFTIYERIRPLF